MQVTKVTLYQNAAGELFEKVSPAKALDAESAVKAVEGEGDAAKKFFVVPAKTVTAVAATK